MPTRHLLLATATTAALLGGAAPASAHGTTPLTPGADPAKLDPAEVAGLGFQHAEEHRLWRIQRAQEAREWERMTPKQRRAVKARAAATTTQPAVDPKVGGAWSAAFPHRSFGMHATLLPTGKVLYWSLPLGTFGKQPNQGLAWLWDPAKGTGASAFRNVDPPLVDADGDGVKETAPLYCSGQSLLPDGRVLAVGGNKRWTDDGTFVGWEGVLTFDPWSETWAQQPSMQRGRWYPSQVLTGDGETLVVGGLLGQPNDLQDGVTELFTPSAQPTGTDGVLTRFGPTAWQNFELYPVLFTMPSGQVLTAGPISWQTSLIDPRTGRFHWDLTPGATRGPDMHQSRTGGTAVLRAGGPEGSDVVTNIGGIEYDIDDPEGDGPWPGTATSETLDLSPADGSAPAWRYDAQLHVARANHNAVLLPGGGVVVVGGGRGQSQQAGQRWTYPNGEARPVELLEPGSSSWTLGAAQAEDRGYHSIALLLPDGRVLSAGDDVNPTTTSDTFELYSPPYLFRGPRPQITNAPTTVRYGSRFEVKASGKPQRAVLMAPGSVTHSTNMTQRHVELQVERTKGGTLTLRAPASGNIAPPGHYMLFVIDDDGVPSVASWVHVAGPVEDPGPLPGDTPDTPDTPDQPSPGTPDPSGPSTPADPSGPATPAQPSLPGPAQPSQPAPSTPGKPQTPTPSTPPKPSPDRTPPPGTLTVPRSALTSVVATGRATFTLKLGERATVTADLRVTGAKKPLAPLRRTYAKGTATLRLTVPRAKRRALVGKRVTLTVVARDAAGNHRKFTYRTTVPAARRR